MVITARSRNPIGVSASVASSIASASPGTVRFGSRLPGFAWENTTPDKSAPTSPCNHAQPRNDLSADANTPRDPADSPAPRSRQKPATIRASSISQRLAAPSAHNASASGATDRV